MRLRKIRARTSRTQHLHPPRVLAAQSPVWSVTPRSTPPPPASGPRPSPSVTATPSSCLRVCPIWRSPMYIPGMSEIAWLLSVCVWPFRMTLSRSCGGEGSVPPAGEGRDLRGQRWPRASAEPPAPDTETRAAVGTSPHMWEAARGQRGPGSAFLVREKVVLSPSTFHYADGGARAPPAAALGPRGSAVPSCDLRARVPRFPWAASIARPP